MVKKRKSMWALSKVLLPRCYWLVALGHDLHHHNDGRQDDGVRRRDGILAGVESVLQLLHQISPWVVVLLITTLVDPAN